MGQGRVAGHTAMTIFIHSGQTEVGCRTACGHAALQPAYRLRAIGHHAFAGGVQAAHGSQSIGVAAIA